MSHPTIERFGRESTCVVHDPWRAASADPFQGSAQTDEIHDPIFCILLIFANSRDQPFTPGNCKSSVNVPQSTKSNLKARKFLSEYCCHFKGLGISKWEKVIKTSSRTPLPPPPLWCWKWNQRPHTCLATPNYWATSPSLSCLFFILGEGFDKSPGSFWVYAASDGPWACSPPASASQAASVAGLGHSGKLISQISMILNRFLLSFTRTLVIEQTWKSAVP